VGSILRRKSNVKCAEMANTQGMLELAQDPRQTVWIELKTTFVADVACMISHQPCGGCLVGMGRRALVGAFKPPGHVSDTSQGNSLSEHDLYRRFRCQDDVRGI